MEIPLVRGLIALAALSIVALLARTRFPDARRDDSDDALLD